MAVETIASGNNAFVQQAPAQRLEQRRAEQQRAEAPSPPPRPRQARPAETTEPRVEEQQKPKPVVNAQGQTTGRIVNTRA